MIEPTPAIVKITNVRWKIVGLICVASFIAYILRTNLSIVGETMMRELRLTEIQLGYVLSAFAWGYALFQFPGGIFGDVVGSRKAITLMAASWGVLTILTGLVPTSVVSIGILLAVLIVVRFLVGASQAPFFPVVGGVIANWFPVSGWGFPNGLTSTAATLGAATVAPILVWLLQLTGWRQTFLITGPLAFVIAVIWWWYGRDYPSMHRAVSQAELDLINKNRELPSDQLQKNIW
ncbi:MAG TPA: MFS transporter, partial [Acidobacteriota bacterium]|nr:MFS transporter [Acidobacteriota bacterium]